MGGTIRIANAKYYREFDGSDNPCCWQVDVVGQEIESILSEQHIQAEEMYEDWGAGYSWTTDGTIHSMQLTCSDPKRAEYEIEYFAYRKKWLLFNKDVPDEESDFEKLVPLLQRLNTGSG